MKFEIAGREITGRIVGRSHELDGGGRRCYLLQCDVTGLVFIVTGDLLKEAS